MSKLKKFKHFNEGIFAGEVGPNYGKQILRNTLSKKDTDLIQSAITGEIYSYDQYQELYNNYLKSGGEILDGFTKENIDKILSEINESVEDTEDNTKDWREKFEEIKDYFLEFQDDELIHEYSICIVRKSVGVYYNHVGFSFPPGSKLDTSNQSTALEHIDRLYEKSNIQDYLRIGVTFKISQYTDGTETSIGTEGGLILSDILRQCNSISKNDWIIQIDLNKKFHRYKLIIITFIEKK